MTRDWIRCPHCAARVEITDVADTNGYALLGRHEVTVRLSSGIDGTEVGSVTYDCPFSGYVRVKVRTAPASEVA